MPKPGSTEPTFGPDLAEDRAFAGNGQIAEQRQDVAAADGVALDPGDDRLGYVADNRLHLFQRQADDPAAVVLALVRRLVAAGAEGAAIRRR